MNLIPVPRWIMDEWLFNLEYMAYYKCNTSAYRAPMALACPKTKPSWKQNPHNCKPSNH